MDKPSKLVILMVASPKETYPIDPFGINQIGVEKWQDSYFMPITGYEYKAIYEDARSIYIQSFCQNLENQTLYWVGVANIKLVYVMTSRIFRQLRLERLKKAGYQSIIMGKQIMSLEEGLADLKNSSFLSSFNFPGVSRKDLLRQRYKTGLSFLKSFRTRSTSESSFSLGNMSWEMAAYCKRFGLSSHRFYTQTYARSQPHSALPAEFSQAIRQFVTTLARRYEFIDRDVEEKFIREFELMLGKAYNFFQRNLRALKTVKHPKLLASGLGGPLHRTLIATWRMSGSPVVGFPHGNSFATCYDTIHIDSDGLSIVPQLYASTKGQASLLKKLAVQHASNLETAEISAPERSLYADLFEKLQKDKPTREIKRIMLIGFPLDKYFYPSLPAHHAFSNLHLELRLAKLLKKHNYEVLYKAHPDRLEETTGLFDSAVDEIVTDKFEDAYNRADAIFFSYSRTSTFGYAMLTRKPMILLNVNDVMWDPRAFELIKRRCRIVPATSNDIGQIQFDSQDVLDAIQSSKDEISYDVIHEFAC